MAAIDPSIYTLSPFNINFALTGGVLVAMEQGSGSGESTYYEVKDFKKNAGAVSRRFPYTAVIEDITYVFNMSGVSAEGRFTLYCTELTASSESGSGEGIPRDIVMEMLNGLGTVKKFVFCTRYPENGEEGTVYIKLRTAGSTEPNAVVSGGQA